jgi:hypothetical protein
MIPISEVWKESSRGITTLGFHRFPTGPEKLYRHQGIPKGVGLWIKRLDHPEKIEAALYKAALKMTEFSKAKTSMDKIVQERGKVLYKDKTYTWNFDYGISQGTEDYLDMKSPAVRLMQELKDEELGEQVHVWFERSCVLGRRVRTLSDMLTLLVNEILKLSNFKIHHLHKWFHDGNHVKITLNSRDYYFKHDNERYQWVLLFSPFKAVPHYNFDAMRIDSTLDLKALQSYSESL